MERLRTVGLGVVVFLATFALGATVARPAGAAPSTLVLVDGDGSSTARPVVVDRLYPGGPSSVSRYVVGVDAPGPRAEIALTFDDLVDDERGCLRPERAAGDDTCGSGSDGELSTQLLVTVVEGPATAGSCPASLGSPTVVAGPLPMSQVAGQRLPITSTALSAGAYRCVEVTYALPRSADNLVQSDRVRFDIVFAAQQDTTPRSTGPARPPVPGAPVPPVPPVPPAPLPPTELPSDVGGEESESPLPEEPVEVLPTVIDRPAPAPDDPSVPQPAPAPEPDVTAAGPDALPATGANAGALAGLAGLVIVAGAGLLRRSRRRVSPRR